MKEFSELKVVVDKNLRQQIFIDGKEYNIATLKLEVDLTKPGVPKLEVTGWLDPDGNLFDLFEQ